MSHDIGASMDEEALETFLQSTGLGVLGLAREDSAYTFPIAFAYDPEESRCLFRFVMPAESRKREFIAETDTASLTVYQWEGPADWHSVVLHGQLREVPTDDIAHAAALFSDVGAEAALDVFNRSLSAYETTWCELDVEDITGRQAV